MHWLRNEVRDEHRPHAASSTYIWILMMKLMTTLRLVLATRLMMSPVCAQYLMTRDEHGMCAAMTGNLIEALVWVPAEL